MMNGTVPAPGPILAPGHDRPMHIVLRTTDGLRQLVPLCEKRRDGRGERTARAVRVRRVDPLVAVTLFDAVRRVQVFGQFGSSTI